MPQESRNVQTNNGDPHSDSKYEGIISYPQGTSQMGIRTDPKQSDSPYQVKKLKEDAEMEKFKRFFADEK